MRLLKQIDFILDCLTSNDLRLVGVVVITFVSHTRGPRFETGTSHFYFYTVFVVVYATIVWTRNDCTILVLLRIQ